MPPLDEPISSPNRPPEDSLASLKLQYEQLEAELTDFQASSKELEAELEKDVEAAEKRERQLKEKVEGLGFEVDEWKVRETDLAAAPARPDMTALSFLFEQQLNVSLCRQNSSNQKQKRIRPRTSYRKRLQPFATLIGPYS